MGKDCCLVVLSSVRWFCGVEVFLLQFGLLWSGDSRSSLRVWGFEKLTLIGAEGHWAGAHLEARSAGWCIVLLIQCVD